MQHDQIFGYDFYFTGRQIGIFARPFRYRTGYLYDILTPQFIRFIA